MKDKSMNFCAFEDISNLQNSKRRRKKNITIKHVKKKELNKNENVIEINLQMQIELKKRTKFCSSYLLFANLQTQFIKQTE